MSNALWNLPFHYTGAPHPRLASLGLVPVALLVHVACLQHDVMMQLVAVLSQGVVIDSGGISPPSFPFYFLYMMLSHHSALTSFEINGFSSGRSYDGTLQSE